MPARRSSAATAPARTPALSRRHAAGAPSARGLLFTLLGEFVLTGDGTAWTSAVLAVFARLGIEEKATRQALMRTGRRGLARAGEDRPPHPLAADRKRAPPAHRRRGAHLLLHRPRAGLGRPVAAGVRAHPGKRPAGPALVRTRLSWAGFGSLGAGLWISPHPEREAEAIEALREAGVADDAHVFVARRSGLADVRGMVATAWDLAAIEEQYEQFIEEFRGRTPEDVLARQVELVHAWRRFPSVDPALPRELLPARWSGLAAARLFADRIRAGRTARGGVETPERPAGTAAVTCYELLTQSSSA